MIHFDLDERQYIGFKECIFVVTYSVIYTIIGVVFDWFTTNIGVIIGFFMYMIIAHLGIFIFYEIKR